MVSMLEDMLLRYSNGKARLRSLLLEYLDGCSLRQMRLGSRVLHDLIDRYADRMFGKLVISDPWFYHTDTSSLQSVAPFCQALTIRLGLKLVPMEQQRPRGLLLKSQPIDRPRLVGENNKSARERWRVVRHALATPSLKLPTSSPATPIDGLSATTRSTTSSMRPASSKMSATSAKHVWNAFFSKCQKLESITISTNGEPGWPGRTQVEDDLVDLRLALESADLSRARYVRLAPVHAMGIIHLRWSGFGAFGAVSVKSSNIWSNLHTLDVQLKNPFLAKHKLSEWQQVMFRKILYDYLLSFAGTLKCLRFMWLEEDGPSPMTLDLEPGLEGCRQAIIWTALEEVSLGNILLPRRTIRLLPERIIKPGVRLRTLRSTHRHSRARFEDDDAWVEVLLGRTPQSIDRDQVFSQASSVYSQ